jgi:hypothetical protein
MANLPSYSQFEFEKNTEFQFCASPSQIPSFCFTKLSFGSSLIGISAERNRSDYHRGMGMGFQVPLHVPIPRSWSSRSFEQCLPTGLHGVESLASSESGCLLFGHASPRRMEGLHHHCQRESEETRVRSYRVKMK